VHRPLPRFAEAVGSVEARPSRGGEYAVSPRKGDASLLLVRTTRVGRDIPSPTHLVAARRKRSDRTKIAKQDGARIGSPLRRKPNGCGQRRGCDGYSR